MAFPVFAAETVVDIGSLTDGSYTGYTIVSTGSIKTLTVTGDGVVLTGTNNALSVVIDAGKTLTLRDATIANSDNSVRVPAIKVSGTGCVLMLEGTNAATANVNVAGVHVPATASLTINGTGSLTAKGGNGSTTGIGGGAGIGGDAYTNGSGETCGSVTILGGTLTATGGAGSTNSSGGAGIGGGGSGTFGTGGAGGNVIIRGGIINAQGGEPDSGGGYSRAIGYGAKGSGGIDGALGTTIITGGSVRTNEPLDTSWVDQPTYDGTNPVAAYTTFPIEYAPADKGKTISFLVSPAGYTYTFTVPDDGKAYLWLPNGVGVPTQADVSGLAVPSLTSVTAAYDGTNCVVTLSPGGVAWDRINADGTGPASGLGTTDDTVTVAGTYYYRAKSAASGSPLALTAYSDYRPITLVAPAITNAATALSVAQGATGTLTVTATGTPTPAFSATLQGGGNLPGWITINASTGVITANPAAGQVTGDTVITVTAKNGIGTDQTKDFTITVTAGSPGGDPSDPTDPAQNLSTLLSKLNTALNPKASVAGLPSIPATVGTPITKAIPGNATFAKKDAPAAAFPGYAPLAPSFSSSVVLNGDTTGNVLALKYTITVDKLAGFEGWGSMTDAQRAALLDSLKVIFAYEYADKTWKTLVGTGGIISWADALKAGIVSFSATGLSLNYAVTDATGNPTASGSVLAIPDGAKDNRIVDPVWLLTGSTVPTGVTLNRTTLILKPGASFQLTATVSPDTATNKKVTWKSSNPNFATVDAMGKVTAVALGTAIITVTTEDGGKTVTCTVTVSDEALEIDLSGLGLVNGKLEIEPGETVDLRIETDPAGATFTATGLPQGLTLTSDGRLYGTVPEIGTYTVTVTATLNGETASETFTIEVTERGVKGHSSSGGCNAGLGVGGLALAVLALARRRRERA